MRQPFDKLRQTDFVLDKISTLDKPIRPNSTENVRGWAMTIFPATKIWSPSFPSLSVFDFILSHSSNTSFGDK